MRWLHVDVCLAVTVACLWLFFWSTRACARIIFFLLGVSFHCLCPRLLCTLVTMNSFRLAQLAVILPLGFVFAAVHTYGGRTLRVNMRLTSPYFKRLLRYVAEIEFSCPKSARDNGVRHSVLWYTESARGSWPQGRGKWNKNIIYIARSLVLKVQTERLDPETLPCFKKNNLLKFKIGLLGFRPTRRTSSIRHLLCRYGHVSCLHFVKQLANTSVGPTVGSIRISS